MRRPVIALLLCLPLIAALGALVAPRPAQPDRSASPGVYSQIANRLYASKGWLVLDPKTNRVVLSEDARQHEAAEAFFERSLLSRDARAPSRWRIENGLVINLFPWAHATALPFDHRETWTGSAYFRDDTVGATLYSGSGELTLQPREFNTPRRRQVVELFSGALAAEGDTIDLYEQPEAAGPQAWTLRLVLAGDHVLVTRKRGRAIVRLEGAVLNNGTRALAPGGQLSITEPGGGRTVTFVSGGRARSAISIDQPLSGRYRRPELADFAEPLEGGMEELVRAGLPANVTVTTSLDRALQARLQKQLADFCRGAGVFPAAVTVMDANTGEILAVASYGDKADRAGEPTINYNFRALPIGSAAKPPIAAAILSYRRDLMGLEVRGGGAKIEELLGIPLVSEMNEEAVGLDGSWIDFDSFIQHSSNRYAATLMLLAATSRPDADGDFSARQPYRLGGVETLHLPPLAFGMSPSKKGPVLDRQDDKIPWASELETLFGIPYESRGAKRRDFADDRHDLGVWSTYLGDPRLRRRAEAMRLSDRRRYQPPLPPSLRLISPVRTKFATDTGVSFRQNYVNMIIGGGDYGWTGIKLAESYARLATGGAVNATFARQRPDLVVPDWSLDAQVRGKVAGAMRKVTEPGGTASGMLGGTVQELSSLASARGEGFGFFSKTGSPRIENRIPSKLQKARDALIAARLLRLSEFGIVLAVDGKIHALEPRDKRRTAEAALQANATGRSILRKYNVSARSALATARQFNGDASQNLFRFQNGLLISALAEGVSKEEDTKVYAFVAARYEPGAPIGGRPTRALAVVINVQRQWLDGNEAVIFARCALPTSIGPVLFNDLNQTAAPSAFCRSVGFR